MSPKSSDVSAGNAALAQDYNYLRDDALRILATAGSTVTLSTGAGSVTPSNGEGFYAIAAESGVEDVLDSLSGGAAGDILLLIADTGDTIYIAHGTGSGEFVNPDGRDLVLTGNRIFMVRHNGTGWQFVGAPFHQMAVLPISVFNSDEQIVVGNGIVGIPIDAKLDGWILKDVTAMVSTQGVTGATDIQIRRRRSGANADMLSTKVTIGAEYFASDGVINATYEDVAEGDLLFVDVDAIHTTAPYGLSLTLKFDEY